MTNDPFLLRRSSLTSEEIKVLKEIKKRKQMEEDEDEKEYLKMWEKRKCQKN